jgi:hypothetical protein
MKRATVTILCIDQAILYKASRKLCEENLKFDFCRTPCSEPKDYYVWTVHIKLRNEVYEFNLAPKLVATCGEIDVRLSYDRLSDSVVYGISYCGALSAAGIARRIADE